MEIGRSWRAGCDVNHAFFIVFPDCYFKVLSPNYKKKKKKMIDILKGYTLVRGVSSCALAHRNATQDIHKRNNLPFRFVFHQTLALAYTFRMFGIYAKRCIWLF